MSDELSWCDLARVVENSFNMEFRTATHDIWKEDAITIALLRRVRDILDNVVIDDPINRVSVAARLYKADGKHEEQYGDTAIRVRIEYSDSHILDGVAFYEAKVRDWNSPSIPQAKKPQLAKMYKNLWSGSLLVFDRERVEARISGVLQAPWWWERRFHPLLTAMAPVTHALSMPLGPVLGCKKLDTSLYKFATPWASQLILRNLQGFDLDHDEDVVQQSSGYAEKKGVPRNVLALAVKHGPGKPLLPDINDERLELLDGKPDRPRRPG